MSGAPRSRLETAPHRLFLLSPGVQSAIVGPLWGNDFTQVVQETVGVGKAFPDFQLWSMNFHFHRVKESCWLISNSEWETEPQTKANIWGTCASQLGDTEVFRAAHHSQPCFWSMGGGFLQRDASLLAFGIFYNFSQGSAPKAKRKPERRTHAFVHEYTYLLYTHTCMCTHTHNWHCIIISSSQVPGLIL